MLTTQGDTLTFRHELALQTILELIAPTHRHVLHRMALDALRAEPAEKALADALKLIAPRADSAWAAGQYAESLQALAALKAPVDAFFESVMVNAEDPALKANRLGLLATLHAAMNRVADLSRLAA